MNHELQIRALIIRVDAQEQEIGRMKEAMAKLAAAIPDFHIDDDSWSIEQSRRKYAAAEACEKAAK